MPKYDDCRTCSGHGFVGTADSDYACPTCEYRAQVAALTTAMHEQQQGHDDTYGAAMRDLLACQARAQKLTTRAERAERERDEAKRLSVVYLDESRKHWEDANQAKAQVAALTTRAETAELSGEKARGFLHGHIRRSVQFIADRNNALTRAETAEADRDAARAAEIAARARAGWLAEVLSYCRQELEYWVTGDACDCEPCPDCGKMPAECTGTPCAQNCQCNECRFCHGDIAIRQADAALAHADRDDVAAAQAAEQAERALELARERLTIWNHHNASEYPMVVEDPELAATSLINEDYAIGQIDTALAGLRRVMGKGE